MRPGNHVLDDDELVIWEKVRAQSLLKMFPEYDALRPILEAAMYDYEQNNEERIGK